MKYWIHFSILSLVFSACSSLAPLPTPTPTSAPLINLAPTSTHIPSPTSSLTPTPSLTPFPISQICTPLQDHELARISEYISHPFADPIGSNLETGHHGVDFSYYSKDGSGPPIDGNPVQSMLTGKIVGIGINRLPYGNMLVIETPFENLPETVIELFDIQAGRSLYLLYAHMLASPSHTLGQPINCGALLGHVGNSGFSGNPHLHLETRVGSSGLDLPTMIFYDTTATLEEQAAYKEWRSSDTFKLFDPTNFLNLAGDN